MAELDLTNIANSSISTPASGVTAVFVDSTPSPVLLSTKDSSGNIQNYVSSTSTSTLTNKSLSDSTTAIINVTTASKELEFSLGGSSASTILTLATNQTTSQILNIPNITGTDTIDTLNLAQVITGVKTMTNMTTAAGTTAIPSMTFTSGTNMTTPTAGVVEFDSTSLYTTNDTTNGRRAWDNWNYFRLTGSGSGITTIADFFGTNDGIPLVANGVYEIEWDCWFSQVTAGTATWTIVTATTALANLTAYYIGTPVGGIGTVGTPQMAGVQVTSSSSTALPVTGTEATTATHRFKICAVAIAGNGASNIRLRLTMSAGTATPLVNSYFKIRRLPAGNVGTYVA